MPFFTISRFDIRILGFAMRRLTKAASIIAAVCLSGLPATANAADDTFSCLNDFTGPPLDVTGTEYVDNDWFWFEEGTRFDARGEIFTSQSLIADGTKSKYPIDIRALGERQCWAGGLVQATDDLNATWADRKAAASTGIMSQEANIVIDGARIHNAHDAIRPAWSKDGAATVGFTIRNSWVSYNRDDCIENDWHAGGLIDDSLFDGCYVFASATGGAEKSPNVVTITNSLVYLQEQPGPNGWPDPAVMGHGELFKWSSLGPDVIIRDTIFLIEDYTTTDWNSDGQPDHSANALAFKNLADCSNVTVVWDGPGDYPVSVPACVTVTKDRSVWDAARAAWLVNHPLVARIEGVDEPAPEPAPEPDITLEPAPEPDITLEPAPEPDSTLESAPDTTDETSRPKKSWGGFRSTDKQSPTVDIISPVKGTKVFPSTSVWIEVDAFDNVDVARLEVYIDGGTPHVFAGNGTHGFAWIADDSTSRHVIKARAYDARGNKSSERTWVYTVQ